MNQVSISLSRNHNPPVKDIFLCSRVRKGWLNFDGSSGGGMLKTERKILVGHGIKLTENPGQHQSRDLYLKGTDFLIFTFLGFNREN